MSVRNSVFAFKISEQARYRWRVFFRVIAAFIGGYILTALLTAVLAKILPLSRVDAVVLTSMLSYIWFLGIIIWAFAVKSLFRLCVILTGIVFLLAVINHFLPSGLAG